MFTSNVFGQRQYRTVYLASRCGQTNIVHSNGHRMGYRYRQRLKFACFLKFPPQSADSRTKYRFNASRLVTNSLLTFTNSNWTKLPSLPLFPFRIQRCNNAKDTLLLSRPFGSNLLASFSVKPQGGTALESSEMNWFSSFPDHLARRHR